MGEPTAAGKERPHNRAIDLPIDVPSQGVSDCFDDDGQPKRMGTIGTASLGIAKKMLGPVGVTTMAWALAQLGWIAGPAVIISLLFVTYHVSTLLSQCYRSGDPISGKRNSTYIDAVQSILGEAKAVKVCVLIWYCFIFGGTIGRTIAASKSMRSIDRSICFYKSGSRNSCHKSDNLYMIIFGLVEIIFSQIPNFDQSPSLSNVAAVMSLTYSLVCLGLGITKFATDTGKIHGNIIGIRDVTRTQEIWMWSQALGVIGFVFSYPITHMEIQDTIKSSPTEAKTMKRATLLGVGVTTLLYMLHAFMGYAAFRESTPRNLLTTFGFYKPYWLLDIANAAVAIHMSISYQVSCRPLFVLVEKFAEDRFPGGQFITQEITVQNPGFSPNKFNLYRLIWRIIFVITTTIISMLLPFFDHMVGILGALGFGPLAIFFPIEMYIAQMKIPKWSTKWVCLRILCLSGLIISIAATAGSIAGIVHDIKGYKPFKTRY